MKKSELKAIILEVISEGTYGFNDEAIENLKERIKSGIETLEQLEYWLSQPNTLRNSQYLLRIEETLEHHNF